MATNMGKLNSSVVNTSSANGIVKYEMKRINGKYYHVEYFSDGSIKKHLVGKGLGRLVNNSSVSHPSGLSTKKTGSAFRFNESGETSYKIDCECYAENDPIILAIRENCEIADSRPIFDFDGIRYE